MRSAEAFTTMPAPGADSSSAKLIIMELNAISLVGLDTREDWLIGRADPANPHEGQIPLRSPIASRTHGRLRKSGGNWYYFDNPLNTNGTIHNGVPIPHNGGQAHAVRLYEGDILRIDKHGTSQSNPNAVLLVFTMTPAVGRWERYDLRGREQVVIGRSRQCDIIQGMPYISARHAQITLRSGSYCLSDCGSKAGTYLNHRRITGPVVLRDKDSFRLADRTFFLIGDSLFYMADGAPPSRPLTTQPVILRAAIRAKQVKDHQGGGTRTLLQDIRLEIRQGTLVAILGTAGAGKTTVMNCLNGMDLQGVDGSVVYRNVDLLRDFDQMKSLIGSVPQQKVFHRTFTPEQEFRFAARKRLPGDTTREEITQRVDKTLEMLSIQGVRKTPNHMLSGGEQTRVNVGIELVADRELLCLDEPDQGLSPNYKHELFVILRRLAHENGKTMLTIIHDVSEIDMFDQVIMLAKKDGVGRLAFSGTPQEARRFFGVDIRDAYELLDKHPERYIR